MQSGQGAAVRGVGLWLHPRDFCTDCVIREGEQY